MDAPHRGHRSRLPLEQLIRKTAAISVASAFLSSGCSRNFIQATVLHVDRRKFLTLSVSFLCLFHSIFKNPFLDLQLHAKRFQEALYFWSVQFVGHLR